ncbi:hypothetical protein WJX72_007804 [[Myrmecia] bisecta]|uniref:Tetratricopeptide repeat protein 26 n=1 Tax=[Myrmecia] bisecta TaxID=41462 RepID=A0AAW1R7F1_9CHLO
MILSKSRVQASKAVDQGANKSKNRVPDLETFLEKRDYAGAIALLNFKRRTAERDPKTLEWLAYAYYHFGEHDKALKIYKELLQDEDPDPLHYCYGAACLYYMGLHSKAEQMALEGPKCALQTRLLFHCAHKLGDETKLMHYHQQLTESDEDQLSLASMHFLRSHFQEAADVYKQALLEKQEYLALNVYIALCYSKLDFHDISVEMLDNYLASFPDSALAVNIKAAVLFKWNNAEAAEATLKSLEAHSSSYMDNDLVRHNSVVFRNGENALQVLLPLLDLAPEARLNLVIYHLRAGSLEEAFKLVKDLQPATPQEYIIKGVVHAAWGQQTDSAEHLKLAQQCFHLVGSSQSECDTIPGRQCMASCLFLQHQYDDVMVYLSSIKEHLKADNDFNWNLGLTLALTGNFSDAEDALLAIQQDGYRADSTYILWLARCLIMNGKPQSAWEMYMRMGTSDKSFNLLQLIANDCYKQGHFLFAAHAFDVLERLDPSADYWEGKQGACIGTLQLVIAGKEAPEALRDVVEMLETAAHQNAELILRAVQKWGLENGMRF